MAEMNKGENSRPVPDPTLLTTEALRREIELLRKEIEMRLVERSKLFDNKFDNIDERFDRLDAHRKEAKEDTRLEVEAALTAQRELVVQQARAQQEAVDKSEVAFKEQLEGLKSALARVEENLRRDIEETKKRIASVE